MIYPPNPVPAFKLEGKLEGKAGRTRVARSMYCPRHAFLREAVFNKLAKFMPDQTEKLTKVAWLVRACWWPLQSIHVRVHMRSCEEDNVDKFLTTDVTKPKAS